MPFGSYLIIEGKKELIGSFGSDSEAYLAGQSAFSEWVDKNIPTEDRQFWVKEDSTDLEFGFLTEELPCL